MAQCEFAKKQSKKEPSLTNPTLLTPLFKTEQKHWMSEETKAKTNTVQIKRVSLVVKEFKKWNICGYVKLQRTSLSLWSSRKNSRNIRVSCQNDFIWNILQLQISSTCSTCMSLFYTYTLIFPCYSMSKDWHRHTWRCSRVIRSLFFQHSTILFQACFQSCFDQTFCNAS